MAGLVIPVTLLITFIVLNFTGQTFNLMTLGGLAAAVGLVIDDAIVVLENIVLHRDAGQSRFEAIRSALSELTVPLIGSTITPIVVFLPLISTTGVTGTFFRALAVTMTVALATSLLLALTWTPTLSQYLVRRKDTAGAATTSQGPDMAALLAAEEAHLSGLFFWAHRELLYAGDASGFAAPLGVGGGFSSDRRFIVCVLQLSGHGILARNG